MHKPTHILPVALISLLASCASHTITVQHAQATAKDTLLEQVNRDYVSTTLVGQGGAIAQAEARQLQYQRNQSREAKLNAIDGVKVRRIPREGDTLCDYVVEMGDILFAYDSFELTPDATDILDQLAEAIAEIPGTKVEVIGHTDSDGTEEYNLNLSRLRALSVGNHLRGSGISDITETGLGEASPIASNDTEAGRRRNRRVEVKLLTDQP